MTRQRVWLVSAVCLGLLPLAALSDPTPEELAANRRKLEASSAEDRARLRRDIRYFLELPPERQARIVNSYEQLQKESPSRRERLENVLERYVAWLDRLDPAERNKVLEAPTPKARLEIIRKLREDEWLKKQPRATREAVNRLEGDARSRRIQQLRRADRRRHQEWVVAGRFWDDLVKKHPMPVRLTDFPQDVQAYFNDYLRHFASPEELNRLRKAEGLWPSYPLTLVELADRYPPALPGPRGPLHFRDLPSEVQRRFPKGKLPTFIRKSEGHWPDLARTLSEVAKKRGWVFSHELWPYNVKGLSLEVRQFVEKTLQPVLTTDEKLELFHVTKLERWPDYPLTLKKLAEKHDLRVPWQTLPGPRVSWDRYRLKADIKR
jgi:hypothetical protein